MASYCDFLIYIFFNGKIGKLWWDTVYINLYAYEIVTPSPKIF